VAEFARRQKCKSAYDPSVDEDQLLARYGTHPTGPAIDEVRHRLDELTRSGPDADTVAMKLLCVHLFNAGAVGDVLQIWRAKESGWDAHCSIDVQLLCGPGLAATKQHLAATGGDEASAALSHITKCEQSGDFADFSPAEYSAWYDSYYEVSPDPGRGPH
jgi:hypothetical protein